MKIIKPSHAQVTYEESIAKAKQANARERAEVERATGLRILDNGQIVLEKKDAVSA